MKTIFKIALFILIGFSFNACLNDEPITDYTEGSIKPIVLIPNGNFPALNPIAPTTLEVSATPANLDLYARVSWSKPLDRDVTVTFAVDPTIVTDYNAKFSTKYEALASDAYQLPSPFSVVIPAGQTEAKVSIKLFSQKVDLSKQTMLALRIVDAGDQTVASNFRKMVFPIAVKNIYDGTYEITGTMVDAASAALTGKFPLKYNLVTLGPSTVEGNDLESGFIPSGRGVWIKNGAADSYYGSFSPIFEFDPATNKVIKVTNYFGQPAGNTRSAELDPSGVNKYDPATKTLEVKFFMIQPSSIPSPPSIRVSFDWKFKYVSARK